VRETSDYEYPIINPEKTALAKRLHTEYFLWYLDNTLELRDTKFENLEALNLLKNKSLDKLDALDTFNWGAPRSENVAELSTNIRKSIAKKKIALLQKRQVSQISQVAGRNVELAYLCFMLSNIADINLDDDIMRTFAQKLIEEGERTEIGYLGTLKDQLVEIYHRKKGAEGYQTENGEVMISNKELYTEFNKKLKEEKLEGVSPHKFKEYLIEFGFTDALNRRKLEVPIPDGEKQSRLCNIFTDRVLRKLGIEETNESNQKLCYISNSVTNIDIQTVLAVKALNPITHGSCPICKKRDISLVWQVLMRDGSRYDAVCMDCGGFLQEELRKRDKA